MPAGAAWSTPACRPDEDALGEGGLLWNLPSRAGIRGTDLCPWPLCGFHSWPSSDPSGARLPPARPPPEPSGREARAPGHSGTCRSAEKPPLWDSSSRRVHADGTADVRLGRRGPPSGLRGGAAERSPGIPVPRVRSSQEGPARISQLAAFLARNVRRAGLTSVCPVNASTEFIFRKVGSGIKNVP